MLEAARSVSSGCIAPWPDEVCFLLQGSGLRFATAQGLVNFNGAADNATGVA